MFQEALEYSVYSALDAGKLYLNVSLLDIINIVEEDEIANASMFLGYGSNFRNFNDAHVWN